MPVQTRSNHYYRAAQGGNKDDNVASIAAELIFVVELMNKKKEHKGSLLIEQSKLQYYDTRRSDKNPHFHILGHHQRKNYITKVGRLGFKPVSHDELGSQRPTLFYIILSKEYDYYLDEVTVVNNVHLTKLRGLASRIPFKWIAHMLFVKEYNNNKKKMMMDGGTKENTRGNARWDAGFTGSNSTDDSVVPGMYVPGRILKTKQETGHHEHETREQTMFQIGCNLMGIADIISSDHPRPDSIMADALFTNEARAGMFAKRWAADVGMINRFKEQCRFEGTSVFATGETSDYKVIKCERHVDSGNSKERGEEHSPTLVALVTVLDDAGHELEVRIGVNIYQKHACSSAYQKWMVLDSIHKSVVVYDREMAKVNAPVNRKDGTLHERFIVPADLPASETTWARDANSDKDAYYSIYANQINSIGDCFKRNRPVMIECLLTIPLTPDPGSWLMGIRNAVRLYTEYLEKPAKLRKNIIEHYITWMMKNHGTVSWGRHSRCQVSQQGRVTRYQIYMSCANFDAIIDLANETDDTKKVVLQMCKSAVGGGVHGVGPFYSQHLINVGIKIGLVKRTGHSLNVAVATSTATYKRLKMMGIRNKRHAEAVVPYLSSVMKDPPEVSENKLCENFRKKFGTDGTQDIFARGHVLYRIVHAKVYTVDLYGRHRRIIFGEESADDIYNPKYRWWEKSLSNRAGEHTVYLTKKRKEKELMENENNN